MFRVRFLCARAHARGFVEVGADFLVPCRAYPTICGFARVAFLGPQGIEPHPMQRGARPKVACSFLQWLPHPPNPAR
jgi:hypothetical protein